MDGPPNSGMGAALGAPPAPGMLQDVVILPEHGVVKLAETLDFAQAACLPCAGVTAWNALMEGPRPVKAGDTVLVLGTGGVSLLALQIAKAAGDKLHLKEHKVVDANGEEFSLSVCSETKRSPLTAREVSVLAFEH